MILGNTLVSPLDRKETKQVNAKGNQPWIFIGGTDAAKDEALILWSPDSKNQFFGKDPSDGKEGADSRWDGWM